MEYTETPQEHTTDSVLQDEWSYKSEGYFRLIVHSDRRVTCNFNGHDGSHADISCND